MKRQTPIATVLYNYLFPHPTPNDPSSFSAHLARNLVPEVRIEVATFYGDLNSTEARYPGLNYCHPSHRMRLGRFKHHKRLFDAFDNLGLTVTEIQDFCCWEGTKWARERYEKDEGVTVFDTTGDDIKPFVDRRERRSSSTDASRRHSITRKTDIEVVVEAVDRTVSLPPPDEDAEMSDAAEEGAQTETEPETPAEATAREQHVASLHRRREQSITQRIITAWEQGQPLSPEIEQLIKEQTELGNVNSSADLSRLMTLRRQPAGRYVSSSGSAVTATQNSRAAA